MTERVGKSRITKGEAISRVMQSLTEIETIVRSLGRMPEGTDYHNRVVEARQAHKTVDHMLRLLSSKTEHTCEVQGCYEVASHRHTVENGTPSTVQLCPRHSALSRFPLATGEESES